MKLSRHAFTTFWDVHAWSGVLAGLLIHVLFFFGAFALFRDELTVWGEPFHHRTALRGPIDVETVFHAALGPSATIPSDFRLYLPTGDYGTLSTCFTDTATDIFRCSHVDLTTGSAVPEREQLGRFLFKLHYLSHDAVPWLEYLAAAVAVALMLAITTGVLIQLKDLSRQFYQFRVERGLRVAWSDMHKVLGVMGLPFQFFFAFTGALLILSPLMFDAFVKPVFDGDETRARAAAYGAPIVPASPKTNTRAPSIPPEILLREARKHVPGFVPRSMNISGWGSSDGTALIWGKVDGIFNSTTGVRLRLGDAALVSVNPATATALATAERWLYGVHFAVFGGAALRAVLAALSLATSLTVLTGNWIWLSRREQRRSSLGNRLLARATCGFGIGPLVSTAALFVCSRLLPFTLGERVAVEQVGFLLVWALCTGWAAISRDLRRTWAHGLFLSAALFAVTPLLSANLSSAGLFGRHPLRDVAGVDAALLVLAALCAVVGWFVACTGERERSRPSEASVSASEARSS